MLILTLLLSIFLLISKVLLNEPKECNEMKSGESLKENVLIEHSIWVNQSLHVMFKTSLDIYKTNSFQLNGNNSLKIVPVVDQGANLLKYMRYAFKLDIPNKGQRLVAILYMEKLMTLSGYIIDLNHLDVQHIETLFKWSTKCDEDDYGICTILSHFPLYNDTKRSFLSIIPFPKSKDGIPQRFFIYYKKDLQCEGCYEVKRYVFIGRKTILAKNQQNMFYFNEKTYDLNGVIVNSSTVITEYEKNGDIYSFEMIEFFGQWFSIFRVSVRKEEESVDMNLVETRQILPLFGCEPFDNIQPPNRTFSKSEILPTLIPIFNVTVNETLENTTISSTESPKQLINYLGLFLVFVIIVGIIGGIFVLFWCHNREVKTNKDSKVVSKSSTH